MEQEKEEIVEVDAQQLESVKEEMKSMFQSKTFWVNVLALVGFWTQKKYGFIIDADLQVTILTGINVWIRSMTSGAVRWKLKKVE